MHRVIIETPWTQEESGNRLYAQADGHILEVHFHPTSTNPLINPFAADYRLWSPSDDLVTAGIATSVDEAKDLVWRALGHTLGYLEERPGEDSEACPAGGARP